MTDAEIWLKYGPDELNAAARDIAAVPPGPKYVAILMSRFGRNWHEVAPLVNTLSLGHDPLGPVDRLVVEVRLAWRGLISKAKGRC